jgi:hypothetical protein
MNKMFQVLMKVLDKVSAKHLGLAVLLVAIPSLGYIAATTDFKAPRSVTRIEVAGEPALRMTPKTIELAEAFMAKYHGSAVYMTILQFEFQKNTRTPFYRNFNDKVTEDIVMGRLKGGSGALPIFIENDGSNNNQMIKIIQGEYFCEPFNAGGLARVWPDLNTVFTVSCRVPIPPGFGSSRGYIVLHFKEPKLRDYEMDAVKVDLMNLANMIDKTSTKQQAFFN